VLERVAAVAEYLEQGIIEAGTRQFVESIALGPGAWDQMPSEVRSVFVGNAATFLDEVRDPAWCTVDLAAVAGCRRPILLTHGDQSAPCFLPVVNRLSDLLPLAEVLTFAGAGHVPVRTHPKEYATAITVFTEAADVTETGRDDHVNGRGRHSATMPRFPPKPVPATRRRIGNSGDAVSRPGSYDGPMPKAAVRNGTADAERDTTWTRTPGSAFESDGASVDMRSDG
jgi:hypothetical protein